MVQKMVSSSIIFFVNILRHITVREGIVKLNPITNICISHCYWVVNL